MMDKSWLDKLSVGDRVIVYNGGDGASIKAVSKVTPTQIVVGNTRYRRKDGHVVGGDTWSRHSLSEATPERVATVRRRVIAKSLAAVKWGGYELADLEKVWAAYKSLPKVGE